MRSHSNKDEQIVYALAARTATPAAATITTSSTAGAFVINVTAASGSPSVVFSVYGVDPGNGATYLILASSAITGTGTTVLRIHPALTGSANAIAKDFLPRTLKITPVHTGTDSITYSLGFIGVNGS